VWKGRGKEKRSKGRKRKNAMQKMEAKETKNHDKQK